jgi:hypothetical protein
MQISVKSIFGVFSFEISIFEIFSFGVFAFEIFSFEILSCSHILCIHDSSRPKISAGNVSDGNSRHTCCVCFSRKCVAVCSTLFSDLGGRAKYHFSQPTRSIFFKMVSETQECSKPVNFRPKRSSQYIAVPIFTDCFLREIKSETDIWATMLVCARCKTCFNHWTTQLSSNLELRLNSKFFKNRPLSPVLKTMEFEAQL